MYVGITRFPPYVGITRELSPRVAAGKPEAWGWRTGGVPGTYRRSREMQTQRDGQRGRSEIKIGPKECHCSRKNQSVLRAAEIRPAADRYERGVPRRCLCCCCGQSSVPRCTHLQRWRGRARPAQPAASGGAPGRPGARGELAGSAAGRAAGGLGRGSLPCLDPRHPARGRARDRPVGTPVRARPAPRRARATAPG